jgi:hypothetical protein
MRIRRGKRAAGLLLLTALAAFGVFGYLHLMDQAADKWSALLLGILALVLGGQALRSA